MEKVPPRELRKANIACVHLKEAPNRELYMDRVDDVVYLKTIEEQSPRVIMNGRLFEHVSPPQMVDGILRETNGEGLEITGISIKEYK